MENTEKSNVSIEEALKILEGAAKQKKDELKNVMSDKYTNLRRAIVEAETGIAHSLSDAKKHAAEAAVRAKEVGVEKAKEIASEVDGSVHRNPWSYIGGTAVVALLLGYVLGRDRK